MKITKDTKKYKNTIGDSLSMYEFADRAGVTVQALLTMYRLGIVKPYKIDSRGQRCYRAEQINNIDPLWIKRSKTLVFYYTLGSEDIYTVEKEVCHLRRRYKDTGIRVDYSPCGLAGCDSVLPLEVLYDVTKRRIRKIAIVNIDRMGYIKRNALKQFLTSHGCLLVDWRDKGCSV